MTCSHDNADDFEIDGYPCPHCGYLGYVRFDTCSCTTTARGTCESCEGEIFLDTRRDDIRSGEVWPDAVTFVPYAYDSVVWPDGPEGRAVISRWRREQEDAT